MFKFGFSSCARTGEGGAHRFEAHIELRPEVIYSRKSRHFAHL